jgi:hypothetical protein
VTVPERVSDDCLTDEPVRSDDSVPQESDVTEESSPVDKAASQTTNEDVSARTADAPASPRMPVLDEELDEESQRRKKADEDTTGMLMEIKRKERAAEEHRGPRPAIAKGLPLAAYSDDQLDEMVAWVRSDGVERTDLETAEELREALGITRRGFQSDAVLGNVVRRTKPAAVARDEAGAESGDQGTPSE